MQAWDVLSLTHEAPTTFDFVCQFCFGARWSLTRPSLSILDPVLLSQEEALIHSKVLGHSPRTLLALSSLLLRRACLELTVFGRIVAAVGNEGIWSTTALVTPSLLCY